MFSLNLSEVYREKCTNPLLWIIERVDVRRKKKRGQVWNWNSGVKAFRHTHAISVLIEIDD